MGDEQIQYERPLMHSESKPLLYRADGTPLKRPIGFNIQTTGTCPPIYKSTGKKKGGRGK